MFVMITFNMFHYFPTSIHVVQIGGYIKLLHLLQLKIVKFGFSSLMIREMDIFCSFPCTSITITSHARPYNWKFLLARATDKHLVSTMEHDPTCVWMNACINIYMPAINVCSKYKISNLKAASLDVCKKGTLL